MPSGEEEREEPAETGDEEASEASSSESRGLAPLPFLRSAGYALDILSGVAVEKASVYSTSITRREKPKSPSPRNCQVECER